MDLRLIVKDEDVKQLILDDVADRVRRLQVDQPKITAVYCPDGFVERFSSYRANMDRVVAKIEASAIDQSEKNAMIRDLYGGSVTMFHGLFALNENKVTTPIRSMDQYVQDAQHHVSRLTRVISEDHAVTDPIFEAYGIVYHRRWMRTAAELVVGPPITLPLQFPRILIVISYLEAKDFYDSRKAIVVDQVTGNRLLKCVNLLSQMSGLQKLKGFELVGFDSTTMSLVNLMKGYSQVKLRYKTVSNRRQILS
ncbi:hypothetical protein HDE_02275 [Halotydeus destructor]|nr:hypothetical protein HDE_02275 [Halotydeus destructor]